MKKVDMILFSCNRACQTDLALRSIKDKFKNIGKICIFYKHSNNELKLGYDKLFNKNYDLEISKRYQNDFAIDFRLAINDLSSFYYTGFCDDELFVKEADCDEILEKLEEEGVSSVSLKIHAKETRHYPGYDTTLPEFIETDPYLKWAWRKFYRNDCDWGYPTNVNAMIYLREYYIKLIEGLSFTCPSDMEGQLNTVRKRFKDYICSFKESKVLNIVVNRVQDVCIINPNTPKYAFTPEELNKRFLDGEIISTKNLYDREVVMTSDEVEYQFERE